MSLNSINQTVGEFINPDTNALRTHSNAGTEDGKNDVPDSKSETYGTYEQAIINSAQGGWNKFLDAYRNEVSEITQQISELKQEIDQKIVSNIKQLQTDKNAEIDKLNRTKGPQSAERQYILEEHNNSKKTVENLQTLLNRPVETHYSSFYLPLLFCLAFAEIGINQLSFTAVGFGEGIYAVILALAAGVIFLFFAHTTGKELKGLTCKEIQPNVSKVYSALTIINVLMFIIMYFLAVARQSLARLQGDSDEPLSELGLSQAGEVVNLTAKAVEDLSLGNEGIFLLIINLAIYCVGTAASFYRHDPHPQYEKAEKEYKKYSEKLYQHKQSHETLVSDLEASSQKKIEFQNNNTSQKEKEINRLEGKLENSEEERKNTLSQVANGLNQSLLAYYRANQTARSSPAPKYFSKQKIKDIENLFND